MSLYDYAKSQNQNEILIFLENVESYQVILYFSAVKIAFLFRDRDHPVNVLSNAVTLAS
jgi:hypothetical protein